MNTNAVICLMIERQHFIKKADRQEYEKLFRLMQPVQPIYWCCPGDPPRIVHRTYINDYEFNYKQRSERTIIKGRFQSGTIAYIFADELELYAAAYRRNIETFTPAEHEIFEVIKREGPMTIQIIKEMTGLLVKQITPIIHKLQEAFLVFEDQVDNEWDRGWFIFRNEFPDVILNKFAKVEAVKELVLRFLSMNVFVDINMIKSFLRLPLKDIKEAVSRLDREGRIRNIVIDGRVGIIKTDDIKIINDYAESKPAQSVFVLHRNDYIVKSNEYWLKEKFRSQEHEILQYILIDGQFGGAVLGKFRNGPFDIEDIILTIPEEDRSGRKDEIIKAVYEVNSPEKSPVKKYCGVICK